ncbi:MAG: hypothetical protein ACI33S_00650 [Bacilli bacterium]
MNFNPFHNIEEISDKELLEKLYSLDVSIPIVLSGKDVELEKANMINSLCNELIDFKSYFGTAEKLKQKITNDNYGVFSVLLKNLQYASDEMILAILGIITCEETQPVFCVIDIDDIDSIESNKIKKILESYIVINVKQKNIKEWVVNNLHPFLSSFYLSLYSSNPDTTISRKKWLIASEILRETGNIYLLKNIFGEDIYSELCKYRLSFKNVYPIEKIINREYKGGYIELIQVNKEYSVDIKSYIYYLSLVDVKNLEVVRNFVIEYARDTYNESLIDLFDTFWIKQNENEKVELERLKATNNMNRKLKIVTYTF